jgi:hypothetical protein
MLDDTPRHKMMANKLMIQVSAGRVDNDWEESFISDIHLRLKASRELTEKQADILERLFDKY